MTHSEAPSFGVQHQGEAALTPSGCPPTTEPLDKERVNNDMNKDKIEQASTNRRGFIRGAAAVGAGAALAPYLGRAGIVGATTSRTPLSPVATAPSRQVSTPSIHSAWPRTPPSTP